MGDTVYLRKLELIRIRGWRQGCAYSISRFLVPYPSQDLPFGPQLHQGTRSWQCGRRLVAPRMEAFSFFSNRIPAMLLRAPLAPPASQRWSSFLSFSTFFLPPMSTNWTSKGIGPGSRFKEEAIGQAWGDRKRMTRKKGEECEG
jgi:hypothetical protein